MNRDLFFAVLSMDSYNRGYSAGLAVEGSQIGTASIAADSGILRDNDGNRLDIPESFYAVAYQWNGATVVSFRGTDSLFDAFTGFDVGAGDPDCAQAYLAASYLWVQLNSRLN